MGDSAIDYVDKSWSPVRGCSRVSEGCRHCWAERDAIRRAKPGEQCHGLVQSHSVLVREGKGARAMASVPRWTGEVRLIEKDIDAPLRWRQPARIATVFSGDWCHPKVPREWRDRMLAVEALCPHHTFLHLTKRAEEQHAYLSDPDLLDRIDDAAGDFDACHANLNAPGRWPLPNVHLGVSVENQATADERIPHLLATPAAVRWVSLEPMLRAVDFQDDEPVPRRYLGCECGGNVCRHKTRLDWLVVGCESLPGRKAGRNADGYPDHARAVIDQARAAGVSVFHKQMPINGRVSHNPTEWPEWARVREFPGAA